MRASKNPRMNCNHIGPLPAMGAPMIGIRHGNVLVNLVFHFILSQIICIADENIPFYVDDGSNNCRSTTLPPSYFGGSLLLVVRYLWYSYTYNGYVHTSSRGRSEEKEHLLATCHRRHEWCLQASNRDFHYSYK